MTPQERKDRICELYASDLSARSISARLGVSIAWIYRVAAQAGLSKTRANGPVVFLGITVQPAVKIALKQEAKKQQMSVSRLASSMLTNVLTSRGYDV